MRLRRAPVDRSGGWPPVAAGTALAVLALTGCVVADRPDPPLALPSSPVCESSETPDSCLNSVRLALQSAFAASAERGEVTRADYERITASVISADRLGGSFSYALLTVPEEGSDDQDAAGPTQFRVTVAGASGTWWMCPQEGRVQVAPCTEAD